MNWRFATAMTNILQMAKYNRGSNPKSHDESKESKAIYNEKEEVK